MNKLPDITPINGDFRAKNIVSIKQFTKPDIASLFDETDAMRDLVRNKHGNGLLRGHLLANLFYEPSTRTSASFEAAMKRLGGDVIQINNVAYSSVAKGESLPDTVRTLEQYADVIVLRHHEIGSAAIAATVAHKPVINAGDGIGEHPTQALLDLYTIYQRKKRIEGLSVGMVGDLKHGRTVHSLARLLSLFSDVQLKYVAPDELAMPIELKKEISVSGTQQLEFNDIEDIIAGVDVLYVTRVQKERFTDPAEYERLKGSYVVTPETMEAAGEAIIMHPLPRVDEIDSRVDSDPRAAYFEQMENGMFVRMALLAKVLGRSALKQASK